VHVHRENRHGPELAWRKSMCWHQEQVLAALASGSIQRTAERLGFVMGAPIGRVFHIDIGCLGAPLSRSKDLSCLGHSDRYPLCRSGWMPSGDEWRP